MDFAVAFAPSASQKPTSMDSRLRGNDEQQQTQIKMDPSVRWDDGNKQQQTHTP
ncbi:MAG TPA: hypothetical protein VGQ93_11845 [Lysobacter sp.]|jgi:hypothetical protein|nr:hypothetical protein [Lysobacter sp.]